MTEVMLFSTHDSSDNRIDLLEHVQSVLAAAYGAHDNEGRLLVNNVVFFH